MRAPHAVTGWLIGVGLGLLDAAWATSQQPGWGPSTWAAALWIDGLVGLAAGAALGHRLPALPIRPAAAAAATLTVGATLWSLAPVASPPAPAQPAAAGAPSVLWVLIDGLSSDALGPEVRMPALDALRREAATFPRVISPSADHHTALATALTGRLPSGHDAGPGHPLPGDVPTLLELVAQTGVPTTAILNATPDLVRGATEVVRPRPARVFGLTPATAALLLPRVVDAIAGPKGPDRYIPSMDEAVAAALHTITADGPHAVMVELAAPAAPAIDTNGGPTDAETAWRQQVSATDVALQRLLDGVRDSGALDRTTIIISGLRGRDRATDLTSDAADALRVDQVTVPMVLRLPDAPHAGVRAWRQIGLQHIAPTVATLYGADGSDIFDGASQLRLLDQSLRVVRPPWFAAALEVMGPALDHPSVALVLPPRDNAPAAADTTPPANPSEPDGAEADGAPSPDAPALTEVAPDAAPPAADAPSPAPGGPKPTDPRRADANPCDVAYQELGEAVLVARQTDAEGGWHLVVRRGAYALHVDGEANPTPASPWRLYDLYADPNEHGRPLAPDALTCGDLPAEARAAAMLTAGLAAIETSQSGRGRPLPAPPPPASGRRAQMPDPRADTPGIVEGAR